MSDKRAEALRARWADPVQRARLSAAMSEARKRMWQDPAYRARATAKLREPFTRAKLSGECNVMKREAVRAKIRGDKNPMRDPIVRNTHRNAVSTLACLDHKRTGHLWHLLAYETQVARASRASDARGVPIDHDKLHALYSRVLAQLRLTGEARVGQHVFTRPAGFFDER